MISKIIIASLFVAVQCQEHLDAHADHQNVHQNHAVYAAVPHHNNEYDPGHMPNEKSCPVSTFGCIFDDIVHTGHTDCTRGGNEVCQQAGADYCSAFVGFPPKRVCCEVTGVKSPKPKADSRGCPASNRGCILNDYASNTPCQQGGSNICKEAGLDYCGAVFNRPGRRVCCKIARKPAPLPYRATDQVQCPATNAGCIFDDKIGSTDCSEGGNKACAKANEDYCSAWVEGRRVCCMITGKKSKGASTPGRVACPAVNKGCVFSDDTTDVDCSKRGTKDCRIADSDYCGAFYGFPPRRSCCNVAKNPKPKVTPVTVVGGVANVPVAVPVPAVATSADAYAHYAAQYAPQYAAYQPYPADWYRKSGQSQWYKKKA